MHQDSTAVALDSLDQVWSSKLMIITIWGTGITSSCISGCPQSEWPQASQCWRPSCLVPICMWNWSSLSKSVAGYLRLLLLPRHHAVWFAETHSLLCVAQPALPYNQEPWQEEKLSCFMKTNNVLLSYWMPYCQLPSVCPCGDAQAIRIEDQCWRYRP